MFNIIGFLGPSGTGKSTLQKQLGFKPIITWTSRSMRPGEINGVDYFYTTREQILNMYQNGDLIEYAEYNGNLYGVGVNQLNELIKFQQQSSIVVEMNGAKVLKEKFPDKVLIVGVLASYNECKARLIHRKDREIERRLMTYESEVNAVIELSDIIIKNTRENWGKTVQILCALKNK